MIAQAVFLFLATSFGVHAIVSLTAQVLCLCDTIDLVFASSVDALVTSFNPSFVSHRHHLQEEELLMQVGICAVLFCSF